MIRIRDLEFRYGDGEFVLRVPELTVKRGAAVAITGASGCGKTTLLHLVAGIRAPLSGSVVVGDVELASLADSARRAMRVRSIGLVFQAFELLDHLNVLDNVLLPYRISPALTLDRAARDRAVELLCSVGVGDRLRRFADRLSQGERQRVAVCRALLPRPGLVLADEPTGNLDPANTARVLDILLAYTRDNDATLVTVTHDHDLLKRFERVIDFRSFHSLAGATPS